MHKTTSLLLALLLCSSWFAKAEQDKDKAKNPSQATLPPLNQQIVDDHKQLYDSSCIPMTVEMVLKLTGHAPSNYFELQDAWKNKTDGNFSDFDGKTINGLTFHKQFGLPRDDKFPLDRLFATIDKELDSGRFVIVSLVSGSGWHMFVIHGRDADGDFIAVSKYGTKAQGAKTIEAKHLKSNITKMKGTDILTYEEAR